MTYTYYDGNGNPTTDNGYTLAFDAENRQKTHGTFSADYNGDGLRVRKQFGTGTTYYLYDGATLVCEMDASGTVTATNTFGANGLVSRRTGTTSVFYTFDPQGSVAQRLDGNGNVLSNDLYDAYGNKLAGNPGSDPYGYGGQWGYYTDVNPSLGGLILCTHRYYDPNLGRWLTRDPIGYAGGINLYGYVLNNPVDRIDPSGLAVYLPCPGGIAPCIRHCLRRRMVAIGCMVVTYIDNCRDELVVRLVCLCMGWGRGAPPSGPGPAPVPSR